ncbi:metalloregulator ArsR/SmtB family transcription factor [Alkalihalobacillus oceani]|uniref:Metalloregulator ArsR/SmtB family transcription factor n=1 Tax=Halalkalibacter oceani TaxID=1653776 RepID=A0A9X2IQF8_9BACI|nr:metalloregulator ArsR/SmtB family transcription factor [Halalkalibacter oceani]MCM3714548.1 metalloregulator ArsR/SmtB family transcription factor [Halalkalibacter oceani]
MGAEKLDIFQAIADPTRRKLLRLLAGERQSVTMLSQHFQISRVAVSKHLRVLEESKLVSAKKVGRERRYQLEAQALLEVKEWLSFYEQFWDNKMTALKYVVEEDGNGGSRE